LRVVVATSQSLWHERALLALSHLAVLISVYSIAVHAIRVGQDRYHFGAIPAITLSTAGFFPHQGGDGELGPETVS
jgi:hypothetical protein